MIKFVTFAVKTQLNVHDLNNEAVAGNVTDIRIMEFLDEKGNKIEAPAVSGRMLKHWHYEAMRKLINDGVYPLSLCPGCKIGEPIRPGVLEGSMLKQIKPKKLEDEKKFVEKCAICDIHGYLIAQEAKGKDEEELEENEEPEKKKGKKGKGASLRRTSRAMFSWLMPVLGSETTQKQVLHTRVSQQEAMAEGESAAQMIFNKSYASGIYAFVSALDVDRIGLVELNLGSTNPYAIDDNERKNRAKAAIEAYRFMISGQIGASLSHAIPHQNPIEILVVYSETGPLPFPVSPMYSDYVNKTMGMIPKGAQVLYWGQDTYDGVRRLNTINEIFDELLKKV